MDLEELFADVSKYEIDPVNYQYFHQLTDNRTIVFNTYVNDSIVEKVFLPLRDFEKDDSDKPITIILNSGGGSVTDGFFLAHYLANYSKPLNIIVTGMAASMAAVILAAGGKNDKVTRYCFPSSYALIHDGYIALESTESKTADDIMSFNRQVDADIRKFIIENTNITEEEYDTWSRKQWFLNAEQMVEKGLADKILYRE